MCYRPFMIWMTEEKSNMSNDSIRKTQCELTGITATSAAIRYLPSYWKIGAPLVGFAVKKVCEVWPHPAPSAPSREPRQKSRDIDFPRIAGNI